MLLKLKLEQSGCRKYTIEIVYIFGVPLFMLVNYRPYYWLVFTSVSNLTGKKIDAQKIKIKILFIFVLHKSDKFQNKNAFDLDPKLN